MNTSFETSQSKPSKEKSIMKNKFIGLLFSVMIFGLGQNLQSQTLTFKLGSDLGMPGDTVTIPVTVFNFNAVSGYQGTYRWDSTLVDFVDFTSPTAGISNIVGLPGQGIIPLDAVTFTWIDFSGGTVNLPDTSVLMQLRFEIKATATPGITAVIMDSSVTAVGYSNGTSLLAPIINQGTITITNCTSTPDPSFSIVTTICQSALNPQALILGDMGGRFSVDNGATIDSLTGTLDLTTTVAGSSYTISYGFGAPCPAIATQNIQVFGPDDASFTLLDTVCVNDIDPTALLTGLAGGSFSVDNGASIDPVSGILDLATTMVGADYVITYSTNGPCPNTASQSLHVRAADDASFSLPDTICFVGTNPMAIVNGLTGGTFSIDQSASIDPQTGELFLTSTVPNSTYSVSYQTQGDCPSISNQSIFVADIGDASFSYPDTVCVSDPNPLATISGSSGGVFSVTPSGNVNPLTGELDLTGLSNNTAYTITYTLNDICQTSSQRQIVIADLIAPDSVALADLFADCDITVPVPTTMDNCAGMIMGTTPDPLSYTAQGTYVINWTFDDGNGNQTTASQNISVQDLTPPLVICKDLTVQLDGNGQAMITPAQIDNGSSDLCGINTFWLSQTNFNTSDIGQNPVTLFVTDVNGNIDSCTAIVTITTLAPPVVICQNLTIFLDATGQATISPSQIDGGSTVSNGTPQLSISQDSFDCIDVGVIGVSLMVVD
ncbi:MAG: cohesin domain-containing protein, partial [Bacteroidia bacterium]